MKIHVFNPEHDIALACDERHFTPPHVVSELRKDLSFLPVLWAEHDDLVLVEDAVFAEIACRPLLKFSRNSKFISFSALHSLNFSTQNLRIEPWGWDTAIKEQLLTLSPSLANYVPTDEQLTVIRALSNRTFAAEHLLPKLVSLDERLIGESCYAESLDDAFDLFCFQDSVIKKPWSSSGRGIRYVLHEEKYNAPTFVYQQNQWIKNVIAQQGGLMVEPYYNKVRDFGVEFVAEPDGKIAYRGLSLFQTVNGAYAGSLIASEEIKRGKLGKYIDLELFDKVVNNIISVLEPLLKDRYIGPFGVDMMIVAGEGGKGFRLHPCVELNLRHTMGHVANSLKSGNTKILKEMRLYYTDRHQVSIRELGKIRPGD